VPWAVQQVHAGLRGGWAALRDEVVHVNLHRPTATALAALPAAAPRGQAAVEIHNPDGHLRARRAGAGHERGSGRIYAQARAGNTSIK
jgi:hypothetical protein